MNESGTQDISGLKPTGKDAAETPKYELAPQFADGISKIRQRCEQERAALESASILPEKRAAVEKFIQDVEAKLLSVEEVLQGVPPEGQAELSVGWHISQNWRDILGTGLWQSKGRATIHNIEDKEVMSHLGLSLFSTKATEQRPVFAIVPKNFLNESGSGIVRPPTEEELKPDGNDASTASIPDNVRNREKELAHIPNKYLL